MSDRVPTLAFRLLCLFAVPLVAAACGSDGGGPGGGTAGNVGLDQAAAVHDSATPNGVTLTTTSGGVTYTLTIPAGAVEIPTVVTMTPVTRIDTLPLEQLVGAVDLQPQGLVLGKSATLRIAVPHSARAGLGLVGFNYEGDGHALGALLPVDSASTIILSIRHFSGAGAAFATLGQIQLFAPVGPGNESQTYINQLLSLVRLDPRDFLGEYTVMRAWFDSVIAPGVENASNDVALLSAISEYNFWRQIQTPSNLSLDDPVLAPQRQRFAQLALPTLQLAASENNTRCSDEKDLSFANNVLYWQTVAHDLGVDSVGSGLDRATVLAGLCIQVAILNIAYPNPPVVGQPHSLDAEAELRFPSDGSLLIQPFSFTITGTGFQQSSPITGFSDPLGNFTTVLTPTQSTVSIGVQACLFTPQVPYLDVCAGTGLIRGATDLSGLWSGGTFLTGIADMVITQNQNAVHGEYASVPDAFRITASGIITATLSQDSLLNVGIEVFHQRGFDCPTNLVGLGRVSLANSMVISVSGPNCTGSTSSHTLQFVRVTTAFSVSGEYVLDPNSDCGTIPGIDCAEVLQQGSHLLIHLGSGTWDASISGTTYSGTMIGLGSCIFQLCPAPPSRAPISGTFSSSNLSGTVTDPSLGEITFSLPKVQ